MEISRNHKDSRLAPMEVSYHVARTAGIRTARKPKPFASKNKGITNISYNHLNLPIKIAFGTTASIDYLYNATGQKVSKMVNNGSTAVLTEYLDGYQYLKDDSEIELTFFPHAEGYVKHTKDSSNNSRYDYVFNYTDHLGNIRLSYSKDLITGLLTVLEENNYYPFGLKHENYNVSKKQYEMSNPNPELVPCVNCDYKYKYNGKEFQDELGLNVYDMEARNYMPDIGRWGNVDELAEDFYEWSPYNFSFNNPINFSDPTGMAPEEFASTVVNKKGEIIDHKDDGDDNIYLDKRGGEVVGKEREGVKYEVGNKIVQEDLINYNVLFKDGITNIKDWPSLQKVEPIENYFWPVEIMETGIIKSFSWGKRLYYLNKYKKLAKSSKFMKQLIVQLEKDGAKSILKSYNKIVRRLAEHKSKLESGIKYTSSVEREVRTFTQQIKELEIFMIKNNIKF